MARGKRIQCFARARRRRNRAAAPRSKTVARHSEAPGDSCTVTAPSSGVKRRPGGIDSPGHPPRSAAVARPRRARDNRGWPPPTSTAGCRSTEMTRCVATNARWSGSAPTAVAAPRTLAAALPGAKRGGAGPMWRGREDARALLDGAARRRSCAHRSNTAGATASSAST